MDKGKGMFTLYNLYISLKWFKNVKMGYIFLS